MIVLTKTFLPYEQFDLDIILKVTAANLIWIWQVWIAAQIFHKQVIKLYLMYYVCLCRV